MLYYIVNFSKLLSTKIHFMDKTVCLQVAPSCFNTPDFLNNLYFSTVSVSNVSFCRFIFWVLTSLSSRLLNRPTFLLHSDHYLSLQWVLCPVPHLLLIIAFSSYFCSIMGTQNIFYHSTFCRPAVLYLKVN